MYLSLFLFIVGIIGFIVNRKNLLLMLIALEIMLLAVTFLFLMASYVSNDTWGQVYAVLIIVMAGAESVIGLSLLVAYYRITSNIVYYATSMQHTYI
jgi:NADH-ubiquinone oxidoreductase chain 4L